MHSHCTYYTNQQQKHIYIKRKKSNWISLVRIFFSFLAISVSLSSFVCTHLSMHCFLHIIISLFSYGSHFFVVVVVSCPLDTSRRIYVHFPVDQLSSHIHFQQRQQFNLFAFTNIWWNVCISVYVFWMHCIFRRFRGQEMEDDGTYSIYIQREKKRENEIETRTENWVFFHILNIVCLECHCITIIWLCRFFFAILVHTQALSTFGLQLHAIQQKEHTEWSHKWDREKMTNEKKRYEWETRVKWEKKYAPK